MESPGEAIAEARSIGVRGFVLGGVDPADWQRQRELFAREDGVYLAFGVHPYRVAEVGRQSAHAFVDELEQTLASGDARPSFLGEIGLDIAMDRAETLGLQAEIMGRQLALAKLWDLPVCLHIVRAHDKALEVIRAVGLPARGGLVHSFSAAPAIAQTYERLGLHLSFSGSLTLPNARRAKESAAAVHASRVLVETDSPDQTPWNRRPGPSRPAYLTDVVAELSICRQESAAAVAEQTFANARALLVSRIRNEMNKMKR